MTKGSKLITDALFLYEYMYIYSILSFNILLSNKIFTSFKQNRNNISERANTIRHNNAKGIISKTN